MIYPIIAGELCEQLLKILAHHAPGPVAWQWRELHNNASLVRRHRLSLLHVVLPHWCCAKSPALNWMSQIWNHSLETWRDVWASQKAILRMSKSSQQFCARSDYIPHRLLTKDLRITSAYRTKKARWHCGADHITIAGPCGQNSSSST